MAANKSLYIVDASVILKWFLSEEIEDHHQALRLWYDFLKKRIELGIPHYGFAEVLNILARKMPASRALRCFSRIIGSNFYEYAITIELASVACEIMGKSNAISFYDAGYHAIALQNGCIFVTADNKYFSKTKKHGNIMLLKDYGKKR